MGNQYRNRETGEVVTLEGRDASSAVQSGAFEPTDGRVQVQTPRGNYGSVAAQQLLGNSDGLLPPDPLASRGAANDANTAGLYNSFEDSSTAFGQGILSGQTFGLSNLGFDDAAVQAEQHGGLNLLGNVAGAMSLGIGGVGKVLAPGSKAAASIIGGGIEGMAFGAGQATSALILRNEPLTAESVFTEYGTDIFLGGAFGGLGGLAGHGLEKAGGKLFGRGTARLAKDPEEVLAANVLESAGVPLESARGHVLTEDFVGGIHNSSTIADEIAAEVGKRPVVTEQLDLFGGPGTPAGGATAPVEALDEAAAGPSAGQLDLAPSAAKPTPTPEPVATSAPEPVPSSAPRPKTIADLPDEAFTKDYLGGSIVNHLDTNAHSVVMAAEQSGDKALAPLVRKVKAEKAKLSKLINEDLSATAAVPEVAPAGPESFTDTVHRITSGMQGPGRYGSRKVFISDIYEAMKKEPGFEGLSIEDFKKQLLANSRGKDALQLARADYAPAMDPARVKASHTVEANSDFHFVVDPKAGAVPSSAPKAAEVVAPSGPNAQTVGTGARKGRGRLYGPEMVEGLDVPATKATLQSYSDAIDALAKASKQELPPLNLGEELGEVATATKGETKKQFADSVDAIVSGEQLSDKAVARAPELAPKPKTIERTPELAARLEHVNKHTNDLIQALPKNDTAKGYLKSLRTNLGLARQADSPAVVKLLDQAEGKLKGMFDGYNPYVPPKAALPAIAPEIKDAARVYQAARTELFETLYVRDGKIASKRTLQVLGELEPAQAMRVAKSYSEYVKNAKTMGQALGPEWTAKAQLLDQELAKVTKAVRSLVTPESAAVAPGITAAEMITTLGIMEAPDLDGPADDMAKLWLVSAMLKGKFKTAGAEVASKGGSNFAGKLKNWTQHTGGRIATRSVGWGGNPIAAGVKAGVASTGARWALGKIMGQTGQLAAVTAKAGARTEQAVGRLLQTSGKAVRKAAPFAPMALLRSVKFADLEHPKGTSAFEQRAREIRMNVANSYGVQRTVLNNLGPDIAMHYPGVADKTVAQADQTMKFLSQKLPRDPGTVTRLGKSAYKASEQDISKFARYVRAALDPDGELDRIADGNLSVEGAETLRLLYPARFAKFQEHIAANLPLLQETLSYPQQVNLSVLFDVPVNSCMEPTAIKAFQATFAADASNQPVSQAPPGASHVTPLSPAQELLAR